MLSYRLKCRKNTEIKNSKVVKTKIRTMMLLLKCEARNIRKLNFI